MKLHRFRTRPLTMNTHVPVISSCSVPFMKKPMISPAPPPNTANPSIRSLPRSTRHFRKPLVSIKLRARRTTAMGTLNSRYGTPCFFASVSLSPIRANSGSVNGQNGTCLPVVTRSPENVIANNAEIFLADLREMRTVGNFPNCPRAGSGSLKAFVDLDISVLCQFHAGQLKPDVFGVWRALPCHEQMRTLDRLFDTRAQERKAQVRQKFPRHAGLWSSERA
jgi:hypothetical protein